MTKELLPQIVRQKPAAAGSKAYSSRSEVWLRISGFLSTRSPNTQDTYQLVIKEWCRFLGAEAGTDEAAKALLRAKDIHAMAYRNWLEKRPGETPRWLRSKRNAEMEMLPDVTRLYYRPKKNEGLEYTLSNATIAKKFAVLRRLYRMLINANLLRQNPFDSDAAPPPPKDSGRKRPTEMIDFALVKRILDLPDTKNPKGLRDKAMLSLFFGAGLRRSEVQKLRIGDVRWTRDGTPFLYLRATKAKKDAEQALPGWAAEIVMQLVRARKSAGAYPEDYLFVGYTGRGGKRSTSAAVSTVGIYNIFKYYCERAGAKFVSPHSARATAITKLLAEGIPHRKVQEFSRHASIQMVEVYDKRRLSIEENPGRDLEYE
jgi:integrase/recombinase XerD